MEKKKQTLENCSIEDLKQEINRRELLINKIPKRKETIDIGPVIECIEDQLNEALKEDYLDDNLLHHVFEATIEAIYGKEFWGWFNNLSFNE